MAKVRILPDRVANQIAAGEVIERPAAVVKELVENALDAGATRIAVEFRQGGRALMRVEDNGHGMNRDDALLALERHATSKIAAADDLDRLASYGFRGEALPSIASVSRFTLQTRTADDAAGTEVLVNGGRLLHVRDCGRAPGTSIEVAHLFNSVPARRKFLKTDATEAAHIIHCVRLYALACPGTAFTLVEDGRVVFRSPECRNLADRVGEIFGRQLAALAVPIAVEEPGLRLEGLIGRPGVGRPTRHEMLVFVNGRPVDSRTLNYALIESYHESVPRGRYPLAFVFLRCDPAAVDVNVHPAKREVRFRSEPQVRSFVIRSIIARLRELTDPSTPAGGPSARDLPAADPRSDPAASGSWPLARSASVAFARPMVPEPPSPRPALPGATLSAPAPAAPVPLVVPEAGPRVAPSWRYVGVAHGSYVLFETPAGLVLLDRRAAHERVWYERLRGQFQAGEVPSQRLLLPQPVELDAIATAMLVDRIAFLGRHAFEVAEFGRNFFRIEAIPAWMEPADAEPFLREFLGACRDGRLPHGELGPAREELARLAVAKAVRLPVATGEAELRGLLAELFATASPLTSPSGRPTYIELNHGELARRFQK
jgi:DNA mismatch repair protein MutL